MTNAYGLKIKGLKKVSGETKSLRGYYSGEYMEVFYNTATREVWSNYQYSLGQNIWTVYDNPDIIKVGNICQPMTMQQLTDKILAVVSFLAQEEI